MSLIVPPYEIFQDANGDPLENGYIYIGTASLNPEINPIAVYWDVALTIPATQPIRTIGGYPSYNGAPANMYAGSEYSITVRDKNSVLVFTSLVSGDGGTVSNSTVSGYEKNYVQTSVFDSGNTVGWNLGKDSGTTSPISGGTGGSGPQFSSISVDSSTPISGAGSMVINKPSGSVQGATVYTDTFTIDLEDISTPFRIAMSYRTPSTGYASGDLGVFLWDVTANSTIQLSKSSIDNTAGAVGRFNATGTFSANRSYRLIIMSITTWATAFAPAFDRIFLSPDIQSSKSAFNVFGVDSVAALRLSPNQVNGYVAELRGYYSAGDGGGGPMRVFKTTGGPYTDNGGSVIVPTGGSGSSAWVWDWSGEVNVKWFGAKGDSTTDDSAAFQAAIDDGGALYVPDSSGKYRIVTGLTWGGRSMRIRGDGTVNYTPDVDNMPEITFDPAGNTAALFSDFDVEGAVAEGIALSGSASNTQDVMGRITASGKNDLTCFQTSTSNGQKFYTFRNLVIRNFKAGIKFLGDQYNWGEISNIKFSYVAFGVWFADRSVSQHMISIEKVHFANCEVGFLGLKYTGAVSNASIPNVSGFPRYMNINNSVFEFCRYGIYGDSGFSSEAPIKLNQCWFENCYRRAWWIQDIDIIEENVKYSSPNGSYSVAGCVTNSTVNVTVSDSQLFAVGDTVTGTGIQSGTTVLTLTDSTHIELSLATTTSATITITVTVSESSGKISYLSRATADRYNKAKYEGGDMRLGRLTAGKLLGQNKVTTRDTATSSFSVVVTTTTGPTVVSVPDGTLFKPGDYLSPNAILPNPDNRRVLSVAGNNLTMVSMVGILAGSYTATVVHGDVTSSGGGNGIPGAGNTQAGLLLGVDSANPATDIAMDSYIVTYHFANVPTGAILTIPAYSGLIRIKGYASGTQHHSSTWHFLARVAIEQLGTSLQRNGFTAPTMAAPGATNTFTLVSNEATDADYFITVIGTRET